MLAKIIPITAAKDFPKSWRGQANLGICGPEDDECIKGPDGGHKQICAWHFELIMEDRDPDGVA